MALTLEVSPSLFCQITVRPGAMVLVLLSGHHVVNVEERLN